MQRCRQPFSCPVRNYFYLIFSIPRFSVEKGVAKQLVFQQEHFIRHSISCFRKAYVKTHARALQGGQIRFKSKFMYLK